MKIITLLVFLFGSIDIYADQWKPEPNLEEVRKNLNELLETKRCPLCDLRNIVVVGEDLSDSDLNGANLSGMIAIDTIFDGSDLSWVTAVGATIDSAKCRNCVLIGANLEQVHANGTDFERSFLRLAKTNGMKTSDTTNFGRCKMRHIRDAQYKRCTENIDTDDKSSCNNNVTDIELIERLKSTTHAEN